MVLKIGENIRALRRKMDITQEQLAEKLGTSPQSVSRWENGITYPDLEFLPALARILSVTTDELLGCPNKEKEKQCGELAEQLRTAYQNEDTETAVRLLIEIRRDYVDVLISSRQSCGQFEIISQVYNDIHRCNGSWIPNEEILQQIRLLTEDILASDNKVIREEAIRRMVILEDDEHIEAFLNTNSTSSDFSSDALLERRYRARREFDKMNGIREKAFCRHMQEMFWRMTEIAPIRCENNDHWQLICREYKLYFEFLHSLRNITPDSLHPVSGNGIADGWAGNIVSRSIAYAHALAVVGETEQAFTVLDDVISLSEQVWYLPEGTELTFSTPAIRENTAKVVRGTLTRTERGYSISYHPTKPMNRSYNVIVIKSDIVYGNIAPILLRHELGNEGGGFYVGFDKIRTDPRFEGYLTRLQTLLDIGANP